MTSAWKCGPPRLPKREDASAPSRRTGLLLSLGLASTLLVAAPVSQAATVSREVVTDCGSSVLCAKYQLGEPGTVYRFATEPGERSTVSVERTGGVLRFRDLSAPVKAGPGCAQVDERTVECDTTTNPRPLSVTVTGGAGDDVLSVATPLELATILDGGG